MDASHLTRSYPSGTSLTPNAHDRCLEGPTPNHTPTPHPECGHNYECVTGSLHHSDWPLRDLVSDRIKPFRRLHDVLHVTR